MTDAPRDIVTKVPAVTLGFWIIKILATTLGETGGDTVTHDDEPRLSGRHRDLPRRCSSASSRWQIAAQALPPLPLLGDDHRLDHRRARRWPISPTARSASAIPAARCCCSPASSPRCSPGIGRSASISVDTVTHAQGRGVLLGHHHLLADARHRARRLDRRRYAGSATAAARSCSARCSRCSRLLYCSTAVSRVGLFWAAFILTRPLGATVGDFLDKPLAEWRPRVQPPARLGGRWRSRSSSLILILPQRAGGHPGEVAPA